MADQVKNASESFSHEAPKQPESQNRVKGPEAHNIPKQNFEAGVKAAEFVELGEASEVAGEVSEVMKEQSEQKGDSASTSRGRRRMTPAQIKAQLLQKAPPKEIMAHEVKHEIEKEIKYLHKRAKKILRGSGVNAFELNNIVKKIRELQTLLIEIAKMGVDALKNLWVRFVKEMM